MLRPRSANRRPAADAAPRSDSARSRTPRAALACAFAALLPFLVSGAVLRADPAPESAPAAPPKTDAKTPAATNASTEPGAAPKSVTAPASSSAPAPTAAPPKPAPPPPISDLPYRVAVSLAFEPDPVFSPLVRTGTADRVARRLAGTYGALWTVRAREDFLPLESDPLLLDRLVDADLRPLPGADGLDKRFLVAIRSRGSVLHAACREWDAATGDVSAAAEATVADPADLAEALCRLVDRLFRPVVHVEEVDGSKVRLRVRGGELSARAPEEARVGPGSVFRPCFRYLGKDGQVLRIDNVPWTYVVVGDGDRGLFSGALASGVRAPLGTNRVRRAERPAVAVRPLFDATELRLALRARPDEPLAGHRVDLYRKMAAGEASKFEPLRFVADRFGTVRLPFDPAHPMAWLYVTSGESLLARVPYVPGQASAETIALPDDANRLDVEGRLELLELLLIETVARRAVLLSAAKKSAKEGQWTRTDELLARIDALPDAAWFRTQLNAVRVPALDRAKKTKNRIAESRIGTACTDTANLIDRFLDGEKLAAARDELRELRQARPRN